MQYEPEQEQGYTVNHWCWYRSDAGLTKHGIPSAIYKHLTGGKESSLFCRRYRTREEAMEDLQQAMEKAGESTKKS